MTLNLAAISRLFSSTVFREFARKGRSSAFSRLAEQTGIADSVPVSINVGGFYDEAFKLLRREGLRDEYVYRAALTHNVLLGKHSLRTASMLSEFRIGNCKADAVVLNGTGTVYEIKSERDSLSRLENQLVNYRLVFPKLYVITAESYVSEVLRSTSPEVGVMVLNRRQQIRTEREAKFEPNFLNSKAIFESLRLAEAKRVLSSLGVQLPQVPNTKMHGVLSEEFSRLEPLQVHLKTVETLKHTRSLLKLETFVLRLPRSLRPAALTAKISASEHDAFLRAVETPLELARNWA